MTVEKLVPDGLWAEIAPLLPAPPPHQEVAVGGCPTATWSPGSSMYCGPGCPDGMCPPGSRAVAAG
jgi:hypothetical protein